MTPARLREIAANCEDVSFIASEENARELRALADELEHWDWQPIETAPHDGSWILGINNRGNMAVIIWSESARNHFGTYTRGWIHPFSSGDLSSFWNGGCGSVATHWRPLPKPPGC